MGEQIKSRNDSCISYFLFRYSTTANIAIINMHPMKKTSPGCAVIVFAMFVKISGAPWPAAPLSSAGTIGVGIHGLY